MIGLRAAISFGSFFSYRIPDFSSQYAMSSILPSPLSIKLGLVSTAIQYKGKEFGKEIFELVKNKEIGFKIKGRVVVNNFLIKRLKAKKTGDGLDNTFGIRGYTFYEQPLEIFINTSNSKLLEVLFRLRYIGTSDSLCSTLRIDKVDRVPSGFFFARRGYISDLQNSLIIPTKDLSPEDTFEKIDIYTKEKPKLERKFFQLPLDSVKQSKNWTIYRFKYIHV